MNKMEGLNEAYTAILALNSLRNKYAHSLRGEGTSVQIAKLRQAVPSISKENESNDLQFIKAVVGYIIGMISILCPINSKFEEIKEKDIVIELPNRKPKLPKA